MSSHMIRGRQLSRDTEHRKAMRRNLIQSLFEHGKVQTTHAKAKEVKSLAEKLITLAKGKTLNNRRRVIAILQDRRLTDENQDFITEGPKTVIQKLFDDVAPKFADRNGGYTQIIKTAKYRIGDAATLVWLQLVSETKAPTGTIRRSAGLRRKRNEKKHQFAGQILKKRKQGDAPAAAEAPAT